MSTGISAVLSVGKAITARRALEVRFDRCTKPTDPDFLIIEVQTGRTNNIPGVFTIASKSTAKELLLPPHVASQVSRGLSDYLITGAF